jgi:hypothetical protein
MGRRLAFVLLVVVSLVSIALHSWSSDQRDLRRQ